MNDLYADNNIWFFCALFFWCQIFFVLHYFISLRITMFIFFGSNGKFIESVANRAAIVDGDIKHQTIGQTDADVRIIININYME